MNKVINIVIACILMSVTGSTFSYAMDENGDPIVSQKIEDHCLAKGLITSYVYLYRNTVTIDQALTVLKDNWKNGWSTHPNIKYATYVDMQRIIRDAYRTDSHGNYRNDCCTAEIAEEFTLNEMANCVWNMNY